MHNARRLLFRVFFFATVRPIRSCCVTLAVAGQSIGSVLHVDEMRTDVGLLPNETCRRFSFGRFTQIALILFVIFFLTFRVLLVHVRPGLDDKHCRPDVEDA